MGKSKQVYVSKAIESGYEDVCQVVLVNDDVNSLPHVVSTLIKVFDHTQEIAIKVAMEAHNRGKAIAEVESCSLATKHARMIIREGIKANVEKI